MPLPQLPTDREAITDTIYRAVIGFDDHNLEMFNSAFSSTADTTFEMDGRVMDIPTIRTSLLPLIGPMATTHTISNIRIDVKPGASTAKVTATAVVQHCPPGRGHEPDGPKFMAGSKYYVEMVKGDGEVHREAWGLWVCKRFCMEVVWGEGDRGVMQPSSAVKVE